MTQSSITRISWPLLRVQKRQLLSIGRRGTTTKEDRAALDGIINLLDAIQDEFEPQAENLAEYVKSTKPKGAGE